MKPPNTSSTTAARGEVSVVMTFGQLWASFQLFISSPVFSNAIASLCGIDMFIQAGLIYVLMMNVRLRKTVNIKCMHNIHRV